METNERVAVIAVHGIADQRPGQTVRELARLLCHGADGPPRYVQGELHDVLVPVARLEPGCGMEAPPHASADGSRKADRQAPGMPSGFYQAHLAEGGKASETPAAPEQDLGLELNDYLLSRLELPEQDALYEAARVSLRRREDGRHVDIYEMYWADLSRLGASGLLALSSLYQFFFHLSTLAADVVDQLSLSIEGGPAWRFLQRLHAWMAWLMKAPAALVQLCMLLVVLFGMSAFVPDTQKPLVLSVLFTLGGIVLGVFAALVRLRGTTGFARQLKPALLALTALACFGLAVYAFRTDFLGWLYLGSTALGAGLVGVWLVGRYARVTRGVRVPGLLLVLVTVFLLGLRAWLVLPYVTTFSEWIYTTGLNVSELLYAAMLLAWAAYFAVEVVALLLGYWLGRKDSPAIRMSLHTARLCVVLSTGSFAVLSLVLWSVVSYVVTYGIDDVGYEPLVFGDGYWSSAALFLEIQVQELGSFFTPLMLAAGVLGVAAIAVLAPALLEELKPTTNLDSRGVRPHAELWSQRLGDWLGGGMRRLDRLFRVMVPIGAFVGALLFLAFVVRKFAVSFGVVDGIVSWLAGWLDYFRGETLVDAGKWLAGGALTITALGARFTRTFGRLRVVIDAILDVDNYFGDPPNRQPPRARIFSRYASLLRYVKERDYSRLVIVSHSQGTVISAELLRYLHVQRRLGEVVGEVPVTLVTVGSPLRDLYARRFPVLYRWMGPDPVRFAGAMPAAADIGVREWINVSRSGDYVGRSLWTAPGEMERFRVAAPQGAAGVNALREGDRTEFCLGAGGHTHYFSNDALALALEIDRLVGGEPLDTACEAQGLVRTRSRIEADTALAEPSWN